MTLPWKRLIRFQATDGRILRGEPLVDDCVDLGLITEEDQIQARVLSGADIYDTTGQTGLTDEIVTIKTLLGPLTGVDVPVLRCVGLNYAKHSKLLRPYLSHKKDTVLSYLKAFWVLIMSSSRGRPQSAPFPIHLL